MKKFLTIHVNALEWDRLVKVLISRFGIGFSRYSKDFI